MSFPEHRAVTARLIRGTTAAALFAVVAASASAQVLPPTPNTPKANWALYEKFSTANMRGMTFSTNINARWIGETDSLFYNWADHTGQRWFLVNSVTHAKKPLLDQVKLAAQLSVLHHKAYDPWALNSAFTVMNITKDHKNFRFAVDSTRYNWAIATEVLTAMAGRYRGAADSLMTKDEEVEVGGGGGRGAGGGGGRGAAPPAGGPPATPPDFRNFSPDSTAFAFGRNNNLYVFDKTRGDTIQITTAGMTGYSFTAGGRGGGGGQQDSTQQQQGGGDDNTGDGRGGVPANRNVRANVTWSPDSKSFYFSRSDNRAGRELFLVNVLAEPRPTLTHYSYYMPGEDSVPRPEAWTYMRGDKVAKLAPVTKWKDQQYFSPGSVYAGAGGGGRGGGGGGGGGLNPWTIKDGTKMRIIRRDRLQRNMELVEVDIPTGQTKVIVSETKGEAGSLETQSPTYVKQGGDFIWWSERSGWGHFYLYGYDGTLKRQLTSGDWRAEPGIVDLDTLHGALYVRGEGREPGENLYYQHLYRVGLADGSITLLDPGNYNHASSVSKNKKWVIDVSSRLDTMPRVQLRDAVTGKLAMDLETTDMSRLFESGYRYPMPFHTLAADGFTPIYGNMWKPFDFDSTKKYPIIANVYPGPQEEAVSEAFSASSGTQQLAQLGFIVIQIGNRGGTPQRSAAYQDFSYFNMRDYALADKKTGIEQLASRYKFIDIDRVGIFGHSGGGFLTGAAMLLPPFNEFFKVGVSESGNHDNNMYNSNWSEQYHGLKWVAAADTARLTAEARAKGRNSEFTAGVGVTTTELGGRGGRGNGRGGGGGGGGGRGGGGGGGRGGRGGAGGRGAAGGAQAGGADAAAAPAPGTPPDSVFWIYVPTNIDIANNLKGKLLLETGDMDNNVHPGNTIRLINALIQNNKRFDFMIYPGQPHAYGPMAPYAFQLQAEYFAEFLLGDRDFRMSADFKAHTFRPQ